MRQRARLRPGQAYAPQRLAFKTVPAAHRSCHVCRYTCRRRNGISMQSAAVLTPAGGSRAQKPCCPRNTCVPASQGLMYAQFSCGTSAGLVQGWPTSYRGCGEASRTSCGEDPARTAGSGRRVECLERGRGDRAARRGGAPCNCGIAVALGLLALLPCQRQAHLDERRRGGAPLGWVEVLGVLRPPGVIGGHGVPHVLHHIQGATPVQGALRDRVGRVNRRHPLPGEGVSWQRICSMLQPATVRMPGNSAAPAWPAASTSAPAQALHGRGWLQCARYHPKRRHWRDHLAPGRQLRSNALRSS